MRKRVLDTFTHNSLAKGDFIDDYRLNASQACVR